MTAPEDKPPAPFFFGWLPKARGRHRDILVRGRAGGPKASIGRVSGLAVVTAIRTLNTFFAQYLSGHEGSTKRDPNIGVGSSRMWKKNKAND
jgi:hypothetical protein